jgi:ribonuclease HI
MTTYTIAADGACSGNPGPGGYAYIIFGGDPVSGNELSSASGASPHTTNNVMELTAMAEALEAIAYHPAGTVYLRLDSQYCLKGLFEWLDGWKKRGYKSAAGKPVANRELWERVDKIRSALTTVGFVLIPKWVKGHNNDWANEQVDAMAGKMRDKQKELRDGGCPEEQEVPNEIANGLSLSRMAEEAESITGEPQASDPAQVSNSGDISAMQVDVMRSILDLHASGDYSVKRVISEIRANKIALGC